MAIFFVVVFMLLGCSQSDEGNDLPEDVSDESNALVSDDEALAEWEAEKDALISSQAGNIFFFSHTRRFTGTR